MTFVSSIFTVLILCFSADVLALESNYTKAQELNKQGELFHFGRNGVKQDYEKARYYYTQAVKLGSALAANHLGRLYLNGEGVPRDPKKADEWYQESVRLDGSLENQCVNALHPNKELCAIVLSSTSQEAGAAAYHMGTLYESGTKGVSQDKIKAIQLYERAAQQGYHPAKEKLKGLKP